MRDLRIPIGFFFSLAGVILAVTGIVSKQRAPLETVNVDLIAALSILVFGVVMLWLGRRTQ